MANTEVSTAKNFVTVEFGNTEKTWMEIDWYECKGFEISVSNDENLGYQSTYPSLEDIEAIHKCLGQLIELAKKEGN